MPYTDEEIKRFMAAQQAKQEGPATKTTGLGKYALGGAGLVAGAVLGSRGGKGLGKLLTTAAKSGDDIVNVADDAAKAANNAATAGSNLTTKSLGLAGGAAGGMYGVSAGAGAGDELERAAWTGNPLNVDIGKMGPAAALVAAGLIARPGMRAALMSRAGDMKKATTDYGKSVYGKFRKPVGPPPLDHVEPTPFRPAPMPRQSTTFRQSLKLTPTSGIADDIVDDTPAVVRGLEGGGATGIGSITQSPAMTIAINSGVRIDPELAKLIDLGGYTTDEIINGMKTISKVQAAANQKGVVFSTDRLFNIFRQSAVPYGG